MNNKAELEEALNASNGVVEKQSEKALECYVRQLSKDDLEDFRRLNIVMMGV